MAGSLRPVTFSRSESKHHQVTVQMQAQALLSHDVCCHQPWPALLGTLVCAAPELADEVCVRFAVVRNDCLLMHASASFVRGTITD